jgi:hypothetical protein
MTFKDETNDIEAFVNFGAAKGKPDDYFLSEIRMKGELVSSGHGSYMSNMVWDGVRLFDVREPPNYEVIPHPAQKSLPSDSRYRSDLLYLQTDTVENAQEKKTELEDAQR